MGYLSSVTGEVTITPPLSAAEVRESPFRPDVEERKDIVLRVQEDIVETNEGTLTRITGTAIVPAWDESYKAYSLEEHLAERICGMLCWRRSWRLARCGSCWPTAGRPTRRTWTSYNVPRSPTVADLPQLEQRPHERRQRVDGCPRARLTHPTAGLQTPQLKVPVVPAPGDKLPFLPQRPFAVPGDQDRHLTRRHAHAGHSNCNRHMIAGQRYGGTAGVEQPFEVTAVTYRSRTPQIPAGLTLPHDPNNPLDPRNPAIFMLGTRPTGRGTEIVEVAPACCHHGHVLAYPYVTCGWTPCGCGGHSNWICHHPDETGRRCGDEVYWPVRAAGCGEIRNYGTRSDP